ncbi:hypothetical protein [Paraliomyxa miuraensis]|uniref:hypothetical protein n=1 Tax=Paraliomyxa miuraensis TaxID=376150 RepID=UPI0022505F9B|nr:hypothetical protein [Paraliomyxa miuraensis]MCX4239342.1 hypothetical protein [Paraliomyxa miuraensis]
MTTRSIATLLLPLVSVAGCQCADADLVELGSDASSGSSGQPSGSSNGGDGSTGETFDVSRWIGRYHFENPYLPFGERGDPLGTYSLINFEILSDGRAEVLLDDCSFDEPVTSTYEWVASEEGWLTLSPGPDEVSLSLFGLQEVDTLRVQLMGPCRALRFEADGVINTFFTFHPGESCWVDRCTTGAVMQVDYCEGEEPGEACP